MSRRPGMGRILKAHPSVDESMFTVFESRDHSRPATLPPPLTGTLDGDFEEYHYKAKRGKKLKVSPVPQRALESTDETGVSEPVSSMSGPPAHSHSSPEYLCSSRQLRLPPRRYDDPDTHENYSTTDASTGQTMYQHFGSTRDTLGGGAGGHMAHSHLAVRPSISPPQFQAGTSFLLPPPGAPAYPSMQYVGPSASNIPVSDPSHATYVTHPAAYPSTHAMPTQEGCSTTRMGSRVAARQPSTRRTQDGRSMVPSDPYMSNSRHSSTPRYNPYARRLPQTALRNQVIEQSASAPAGPAYPVGPYWGAASPFEQQLEAAPNGTPAMPHDEDFAYPPWSAPRLDTAHVPQPSAAMYAGEWSPTDDSLQALQEMIDRSYNNGGPSTSRPA